LGGGELGVVGARGAAFGAVGAAGGGDDRAARKGGRGVVGAELVDDLDVGLVKPPAAAQGAEQVEVVERRGTPGRSEQSGTHGRTIVASPSDGKIEHTFPSRLGRGRRCGAWIVLRRGARAACRL